MGSMILCVLATLGTLTIVTANSHNQLLKRNQLAVYLMNQLAKDADYICSSPEEPHCNNIVPDADLNVYDNSEDWTEDNIRRVDKKARLRPYGCDCRLNNKQVDLGENFFPRLIKNVTCQQEKCSYNTHCEITTYPVTVLARRLSAYSNEIEENHMPEDLRERWKLHTINMVADCMCTY